MNYSLILCVVFLASLLILGSSSVLAQEIFTLGAFAGNTNNLPSLVASSPSAGTNHCAGGSGTSCPGAPGVVQCTVPATGTGFSACGSASYTALGIVGTGGDILVLTTSDGCVWTVTFAGTAPNTFYTLQSSGCTGSATLTGNTNSIDSIEVSGVTNPTSAETITITVTIPPTVTQCTSPNGNTPVVQGTHTCSHVTSVGSETYDLQAGSTSAFNTFTVTSSELGGTATAVQFAARIEQTVVVGDPQFVGLRGQSYQVHGIDGAVYNLISDSTMQVNARFNFLREGRCPTLAQTGGEISPLSNCFSHPGSYISEIAMQLIQDSRVIRMAVVAGPAAVGFSSVAVDNESVRIGQVVEIGSFLVNRTSSHSVMIHTPLFDFNLDSSDRFINQRLRVNIPLSQLATHGLIGQTRQRPSKPGSIKHIEGEVDDYVILSEDLLGNDFLYNQFKPASQ